MAHPNRRVEVQLRLVARQVTVFVMEVGPKPIRLCRSETQGTHVPVVARIYKKVYILYEWVWGKTQ